MIFKVLGQELLIDCSPVMAGDTIDYLTAQFIFTHDWDNVIKYAHFRKVNSDINYVIELENDEITKNKHLNLSKGDWLVWVHGNEYVDGQVKERITTTQTRINVKESGAINGEPFPEIPASDVERLEAEIHTEIDNRTAEDNKLQAQIDDIKEHIEGYASEDDLLKEETERKEADENIVRALSEEVLTRGNQFENLEANKVDKVEGKGLSTNDFTNEDKEKLDGLQNYDDTQVKKDIADLETEKADKQDTYTKQEVDDLVEQAKPSDYDEVKQQVATNKTDITNIKNLIPSEATSTNKLADKDFVNSSIASNTSTFIGTFNSVAELEAYSGEKTNNDYAFVVINDETTGFVKEYDRYKWTGTQWLFEYSLNNSSFTASQWATINSGLTSQDAANLNNALTAIDNLQNNKADKSEIPTKVSELENDSEYAQKTYVDEEDERIKERIRAIEESRIPNVILSDDPPTINGSQVSGFSLTKYAKFPFLVTLTRPFDIKFEFTTSWDVTNQQNILDSDFGLAFAVRNSRFVVALSTNGTSWNLGEGVGTFAVQPNTSYLVKISWDGNTYTVSYSLDAGQTYIVDITKASNQSLYPKQIYVGVGQSGGTILNYFKGVIDFQYASVSMDGQVIWLGYDDIGLLTRMSTDMSNIDSDGIQKIKDIMQPSIDLLETKADADAVHARIDNLDEKQEKELTILSQLADNKDVLVLVDDENGDKEVPFKEFDYSEHGVSAKLNMLGGMSRKGKNLLKSSLLKKSTAEAGLVATLQADGTYKVTGTLSGANANIWMAGYFSSTTVLLTLQKGTYYSKVDLFNVGTRVVRANEITTLTENTPITGINLTYSGEGTVVNDIVYPFYCEGSTPLPYEPYIDQLIDAKVDDVISYGKNLFDYNSLIDGAFGVNGSRIDLYSIDPEASKNIFKSIRISLKEGTYVISFKYPVGIVREVYEDVENITTKNNITSMSFTLTKPQVIGFSFRDMRFKPSGTERIDWDYTNTIQIEKGSITTAFVPYHEPINHPIPQSAQELDGYGIGINDTLYNYFEKVDDKVYFHKLFNKVTFNENSPLGYFASSGEYYRQSIAFAACGFPDAEAVENGSLNVICNIKNTRAWSYITNADSPNYIGITAEGSAIGITTDKTSRDEVKTWLASNNLEVIYKLAEEVVTDVTDLFPQDFFNLEVESGGTISYHYPALDEGYEISAPNKVTFNIKNKLADMISSLEARVKRLEEIIINFIN